MNSLFYSEKQEQKPKNTKNQLSIVDTYKPAIPPPSKFYPDLDSKKVIAEQSSYRKSYGDEQKLRGSIFIDKSDEDQTWLHKCCACTKLQFYQDFYKVTNKDVIKRIFKAGKFWEGKFFDPVDQEYDFYGPFWILTTIVFCLSSVNNILRYQSQESFTFNFEIIGYAFGACYILGIGFPALLAFFLNFIGVQCKYIQLICLFGYATAVYIPAIAICSLNICILHWALLSVAAVIKGLSIIRNLYAGFQIPAGRKVVILGIVIAECAFQFLIYKFGAIYCMSSTTSSNTSAHHHTHFRSYDF